jgi:hypothetical protein
MDSLVVGGPGRATHGLLVTAAGRLPGGEDAVRSGWGAAPDRASAAEREALRDQIRWSQRQRALRRARRVGRSI